MEKYSVKKPVTFMIVLMIFSVIPALVSAQKKCLDGRCPKGFYCSNGNCIKIWTGPICPHCPYNIIYNYDSKSASISISLEKPDKISIKIFDLTGRLIKTVADKFFEQGEHELHWDAAGVKTGIYIARVNTGTYGEMRKISVVAALANPVKSLRKE